MYRRLQAEQILVTAKTLHHRVSERFSGWGISQVAEELHTLAQEVKTSLAWIAKPILILRLSIGALITVVILLVINGLVHLDISNQAFTPTDILTLIEAAIQDAVFFGAGIYFLVSLENRIKRGRALNRLNQLRALAHVIDMHQLTKDPERVLKRGSSTASSPKEEMTAFLLSRYLDYCSEMLSMIGKIAALYVQDFDDQIILATVNEIESLTTGLSRKIWQKIMIIHQLDQTRSPKKKP